MRVIWLAALGLAFPLPGIKNDTDNDDEHVCSWQDLPLNIVQCHSSESPPLSEVKPRDS